MSINLFPKMKRFLVLFLTVVMMVSLLAVNAHAASGNKITDYGDAYGHWAYEALSWAVDNGVMVGTSEDKLDPDGHLTRAQMAAMIDRLFGTYKSADISRYTDVARGSWYHDYIAQAVKTREVYAAYKKSRHKKEFLAEHGAEIAQHEAAKKAFDALGGKPIPKVAQLSQEYAALLAEKKEQYAEYKALRQDMIDYRTMNGRMEPNEETAPNVRLIFKLARDGRIPNEIVKVLFERHIPTPAEYKAAHGYNGHDISRCYGIWQESSVIHILEDERYTGTYIMGKREVTEVGGHRVRMKDESQWIKIPDHHPAIISKELFDQVQAQRLRFKCPKKNARAYPLRGKMFCGCCRHAMPRTANRNHYFLCRHSKVNEAAPCHGLTVVEAELEGMLYEILSKQAQVILNVADLANAGQLDIQLAKQAEYDKQIKGYLDQKRVLYEQLILKQITMEDCKIQKAAVDSELDRLREIHSNLKAQTAQMEMDEKTKSARTELAREVVGAGGLTAGLADTLIDRVYVYPNNQVEIIWKMKDFCME